jgi:hypothetical protein
MAKLPKQLYVVTRKQSDAVPLGFLGAFEPGKSAFDKRKFTQDKWAYLNFSGMHGTTLKEINGEYWVEGIKWEWDTVLNKSISNPCHQLVELPPQVWDNTPMTGFAITKSVSRYSTSNKLWRILDPRNVEFEITTSSLEEIIMKSTIKNGVIQDPCVWVTSKNLIVE